MAPGLGINGQTFGKVRAQALSRDLCYDSNQCTESSVQLLFADLHWINSVLRAREILECSTAVLPWWAIPLMLWQTCSCATTTLPPYQQSNPLPQNVC